MSRVPYRLYNPYEPSTHQLRDPFHNFHYGALVHASPTASVVSAKFDWMETPEAHVFKADLPGLKEEEVKVEVEEGNIVHVSGGRRVEKEERNDRWHHVERSSSKFVRRFRLPENAKGDHMKACMENGVLTITFPKQDKEYRTANKIIPIA